eukprot:6479841-Amphidinium_carterae.1
MVLTDLLRIVNGLIGSGNWLGGSVVRLPVWRTHSAVGVVRVRSEEVEARRVRAQSLSRERAS